MVSFADLKSTSPTTLPEILGFLLYVGVALLLVWEPNKIQLLGIGASGLTHPFSIPPIFPAILGFIGAHGWLIITFYIKSYSEETN
jgi:hypothetical protein